MLAQWKENSKRTRLLPLKSLLLSSREEISINIISMKWYDDYTAERLKVAPWNFKMDFCLVLNFFSFEVDIFPCKSQRRETREIKMLMSLSFTTHSSSCPLPSNNINPHPSLPPVWNEWNIFFFFHNFCNSLHFYS